MSDYFTERYKLTHRLQGRVNGLGEDIVKLLEGALDTITGKIVALQEKADQTESLIRKRKYLEKQSSEIKRVLSEIYQGIGKEIKDKSIEVAQAAPEIVNSTLKNIVNIKLGVPRLSKKRIIAWFESSQIEGLFFNEWMKKLEGNAVDRIVNETRLSLIFNESHKKAAKRIQNALNIGRRAAEGMAHNAMHGAFNWAEYEMYLENKDEINGFRYRAELDRQTTPLCRSLDGQIFSVKDAPHPPLHWNCRSMLEPVFKLVDIHGKRIARLDTESRTVKHRDGTTSTQYQKREVQFVSGKTTYNQWLTGLINSKDPKNVAFAREVLGPTRFDLVKSGKLKMESLYYGGKLRTIKELKKLYL